MTEGRTGMQELEKILEEIDFLDIIYDVDNGGCLLRQEDVVDVIAWRPLPEPHRPERSTDEKG
ncbi:MAG TPA: hypothetical protein H9722_00785 [Candidatus Mediterraneibacter pullistercoris]|nr:hypothetical protein [Candidatus Mediterraneibacter pullistercoris]